MRANVICITNVISISTDFQDHVFHMLPVRRSIFLFGKKQKLMRLIFKIKCDNYKYKCISFM